MSCQRELEKSIETIRQTIARMERVPTPQAQKLVADLRKMLAAEILNHRKHFCR
jgi:hypothetical protein